MEKDYVAAQWGCESLVLKPIAAWSAHPWGLYKLNVGVSYRAAKLWNPVENKFNPIVV